MSIETLLTLGLTAALLAAAFVLRVVILGSLRLGLRLAGRDTSWTRPQRASRPAASPSADGTPETRRKRPLWTPGSAAALRTKVRGAGAEVGPGLGAAGASLLAVAATAWGGMTRGADALERWADRTSESLQPAMRDITSAARRSTRDIGKYVVAGIATVQHVALLLAGWVRGMWGDTDRDQAIDHRREESTKKVIDLDLDFDEDPLGSSSPPSRITV